MKTGIDIVDIKRIESILNKKRKKFYHKVFTDNEIEFFHNRNSNAETVSGHFAAKEAVSKILGTGIGQIAWKDIEILHDNSGKPYINMNHKIKYFLNKENLNAIDISITHEREYSVAIAIGFSKDEILDLHKNKDMKLPIRNRDSHKGDFGKVGIIAGSQGMTGAAYLSATAALRAGSGLVYSIVSSDIADILSVKFTEVIVKTFNSTEILMNFINTLDGIVIGPGLGVNEEKKAYINEIIKNYKKPIVLDADGINMVDKDILLNREGLTIITPHNGEMARFLGVDVKEIEDNRNYYSKKISNKYNIITILKGNKTIVSYLDKLYINNTGNPGMATAGSGDILTGIIISLICQKIEPYEACTLAVYCHGLAGDMGAQDIGEYGLIASDIIDYLPKALRSLQD